MERADAIKDDATDVGSMSIELKEQKINKYISIMNNIDAMFMAFWKCLLKMHQHHWIS